MIVYKLSALFNNNIAALNFIYLKMYLTSSIDVLLYMCIHKIDNSTDVVK